MGAGEPCRFSTESPGHPRVCLLPIERCIFCDPRAPRTREALRPLALLFIRDVDIYRAALLKVPPEKRVRTRRLVQTQLELMSPGRFYRLLTVRRSTAISAIAALAKNVRDVPVIAAELRDGARQLRAAVPLVKKIGEVPLSIILEYLVGTAFGAHDLLSTAKRKGYSLSRHPAFMVDLTEEQEEDLAYALAHLMQIHQAALALLPDALAAYARAADRVRWHGRVKAVSSVQRLVCELRRSAVLPAGRSLCHESFEPPESP